MATTTSPAPALPSAAATATAAPTSHKAAPQPKASSGPTSRRAARLVSIPLIVLGCIAVAMAATYVVAIFTLGTVKPVLAIMGHSMNPLLYQGDLAVIKATNPVDVQVGDVISLQVTLANQQKYGLPGTIVHRVVSIQDSPTIGRIFTTKGDNNADKDYFVTLADNVNGVMVAHIPKAGYPLLYIQGPSAPLLGAVLGGLIVIYLIIGWAESRGKEAAAREEVITRLASDLPELQTQLDRLTVALSTAGPVAASAFGPPALTPLAGSTVVAGSVVPRVVVFDPPPPGSTNSLPVGAPLELPLAVLPAPASPPLGLPAPAPAAEAAELPPHRIDPLTAPLNEVPRLPQTSVLEAP